jgi:hypothetical protein
VCAVRGVQACRHPFDVAIRDICILSINYVHQKMNKRPHDGSIEKQEQYVLHLAERGDFAAIAELLDVLVLKDAVVCELIRICNAHIKKLCAEFELTRAAFITDMNSM